MSKKFHKEDFFKVLAEHGIQLHERQLQQFEEYASMLIKWNPVSYTHLGTVNCYRNDLYRAVQALSGAE